jgi:mono/diheme cytochrome c family protein
MRTNFAGFFLAVGMGLIVVLLGLGALSMAGLVSIMPAEAFATEQQMPADEAPMVPKGTAAVATAYVPASAEELDAIVAGDALFKSNCAQCHSVNEKVVGPALAGITKRRSIDWIVQWVHNPARIVASGDWYAVNLFNANDKQQMPSFSQLTDKEIQDIVTWVNAGGQLPVAAPCHCLM